MTRLGKWQTNRRSTMRYIYTSPGHRPTDAADAGSQREVGEIFARRKARRLYGRRGTVGALRLDSWSQDGTVMEFDAYIGRPVRDGGVAGRNVRFTVFAVLK